MDHENPSKVQYFPLVLFIVVVSIIGSSWFLFVDKETPNASVQGIQYEGKVSDEMQDFLKLLDGTRDSVYNALSEFGVENLYTANMELYNLGSPVIVGYNSQGLYECYKVDFKTGVTIRAYEICWAQKQIHNVRFVEVR